VIAVTQMNSCLVLLPVWITVVYFALSMLGLAGWQSAWGVRIGLSTCMYVVAFSIVGQEFNRYWGLMLAPLFCFGIVRCPVALSDLWRSAKIQIPQRLNHIAGARGRVV
jgi:hypothetical protein